MSNPLIGQIFVQAPSYEIGKSSYHFESLDNIYIRFDKWGSSDLPNTKTFTHVKFYPANRAFIGLIDWTEEGGYRGEMLWLYFMAFNGDYSTIERGHVTRDGKEVDSFSDRLNYTNLSSVDKEAQSYEVDDTDGDNNSPQKRFVQHRESTIPFRNNESDRLFESIIQINSIDNVGDFIGSLFSNSDNANSKIRKKFQSFVARSTTSFRKEIVENGGFAQFKNDIATMEICGAVMALVFLQTQERGVNKNIAIRILFEGIRATFNLKTSAQSDPVGSALIKIIESYTPDEGLDDLFLNIVLRLIGSNLSGRLQPDYSEILEDYTHLLQSFLPTMDPGFTSFLNKVMSESRILVDDILDTRW